MLLPSLLWSLVKHKREKAGAREPYFPSEVIAKDSVLVVLNLSGGCPKQTKGNYINLAVVPFGFRRYQTYRQGCACLLYSSLDPVFFSLWFKIKPHSSLYVSVFFSSLFVFRWQIRSIPNESSSLHILQTPSVKQLAIPPWDWCRTPILFIWKTLPIDALVIRGLQACRPENSLHRGTPFSITLHGNLGNKSLHV